MARIRANKKQIALDRHHHLFGFFFFLLLLLRLYCLLGSFPSKKNLGLDSTLTNPVAEPGPPNRMTIIQFHLSPHLASFASSSRWTHYQER